MSGGMALAAFGLGVGIAQAEEPTSGNWCPGQPVHGGFTEVNWDWNVCHNYYLQVSAMPRQIVGLKVEDGGFGGNWGVVGRGHQPHLQNFVRVATTDAK